MSTQKIAINTCFGGFGLSEKATELYKKSKGIDSFSYLSNYDIDRDDPDLIAIIEKLGKEANDEFAELSIVEIPAGVKWIIEEYDGLEHISEKHQTWG